MMAVVLYEDFGVRYNPDRISTPKTIDVHDHFFADSRDLFLHGLLSGRSNPPSPNLRAAVPHRRAQGTPLLPPPSAVGMAQHEAPPDLNPLLKIREQ